MVVIVAGYKEPMEQFFKSNPGLKSRFNTFIDFKDYDALQLTEIFENICNHADYVITDELREKVSAYFLEQINKKVDNFSNGRLARNLYETLIINQAKRVSQYKSPSLVLKYSESLNIGSGQSQCGTVFPHTEERSFHTSRNSLSTYRGKRFKISSVF